MLLILANRKNRTVEAMAPGDNSPADTFLRQLAAEPNMLEAVLDGIPMLYAVSVVNNVLVSARRTVRIPNPNLDMMRVRTC